MVVSRSKGDGYKAYLQSRQARAQSYVSKFPLLQKLVDNLESLRDIPKIRNTLYNLCLNQSAQVKMIEGFLDMFKVLSWQPNRLNDYRGRLIQNNWEESTSAWMEAMVTTHYATVVNVNDIEPSPELSSGKRSDVKVTLENRPIFFELTSLGTRMFEEKLETVFEQVADYVLPNLAEGRLVFLQVNAARLPLEEGHRLDVSSSVSMLKACIDCLSLVELFNSPISPLTLNFEDMARISFENKTIRQLNEEELFPGMSLLKLCDTRLAQLMSAESLREWSSRIYPKMALGCPFVLLIAGGATWPLIELQSQLLYPSEAAKYEGPAFLGQLKRAIKQKLEGNQLQEIAPNILVIRAYNWLTHGYERSSELALLGFDAIEGAIKQSLDETRNPNLSMVKIYEDDYAQARSVLNPYAGAKSDLETQELQLV